METGRGCMGNGEASWGEVGVWVVLAVGFGVVYFVSPFYADDFWYATGCRELEGWEGFVQCCRNAGRHLQFDTGRLANLVSPPFLTLLPRWVFAVLYSAAIYFLFSVGSQCFRSGFLSRALWVAFVVLLLPWMEFMFATIYALNYVWTSVFGVATLWAFFRISGGKRMGNGVFALSVAAAFLAGWFHEGFSAPLLAGLFVYDCAVRWRMPRRMWILQGALFLGFVILISFPALWSRAQLDYRGLFSRPITEVVVAFGGFNLMFLLFVAVFVWRLAAGKLRGARLIGENLVILVFGLCTMVLLVKFYNGPRTVWFSQLVCGIGVFRLLCSGGGLRVKKGVAAVVGSVCYLLCGANLAAAIVAQVRLTREFEEVLSEFDASENGVIYKDVEGPGVDLSLMKTSVRNLTTDVTVKFINYYYDKPFGLVILPEALRDFDPRRERPVQMEPWRVYLHRNEIVVAAPKVEAAVVCVDYEGLGEVESRFRQKQFVVSGDTLSYVSAHASEMMGRPRVLGVRF